MKLSIAIILKGYPRLSETFIAQEIRALEQNGLDLLLVSLRHPTDKTTHPIHDEIKADILYLPEYLHHEPLRSVRGFLSCLGKPGLWSAFKIWFKDFRRDPTRNRIRRFGQALVLANEIPSNIVRLYAHFIHTPGSVTRYTAEILAMPWSASAHAKDIWTIPQWEIREKLQHLEWLATCTKANAEHLRSLSDNPAKIDLVYHGLDFDRFNHSTDTDNETRKVIKFISVGRAVPKKGYFFLLDALARLPEHLQWSFTHIGGGPELDGLKTRTLELKLQNSIEWLGPMAQEQVLQHYRKSDVFVLPSHVVEDGDRDGLPNVLMEAQSQRLCCISTDISGIPELIQDGVTGLLVPQKNPEQLADALESVISDPVLRQQLADAGYHRVRKEFSMNKGIVQLMKRFNQSDR